MGKLLTRYDELDAAVEAIAASYGENREIDNLESAALPNRRAVIDKVTYWTGVQRPLVKNVVRSIEAKVRELGLFTEVKAERDHLVEVTAYATTLAMNYLTRGKFVQP